MQKPHSELLKYSTMAFQMLAIILIFTGIGKYGASYINITEKTGMACGAGLGTCISIIQTIRQLKI